MPATIQDILANAPEGVRDALQNPRIRRWALYFIKAIVVVGLFCLLTQLAPHMPAVCVALMVIGIVLLCLFAYAQAAFAADMGNGRMQPLTGLLAGFCAIAAIPGGDDPLLLLCSALWALSNLCRIQPDTEETRHETA